MKKKCATVPARSTCEQFYDLLRSICFSYRLFTWKEEEEEEEEDRRQMKKDERRRIKKKKAKGWEERKEEVS
jgi:hypothetical protein